MAKCAVTVSRSYYVYTRIYIYYIITDISANK